MASDNHAHYARIGFTVLIGAVAIAATLVYMGGFHDPNAELLVETYSDNPVNGLSVGSPVNLFGVKVGEVREISFALATYGSCGADTNDYGRVSIVLALNRKQLGYDEVTHEGMRDFIRARAASGLRATVTANGITGLSRVDLKFVENETPPVLPKWVPRHPLIPPHPSLMDSFAVAATKLMNKLKRMDFEVVWSNVNRTAEASARLSERADEMLESRRADVQRIVTDVGETSVMLREMVDMLKQNPSLLIRPSDPEPLPETAR